MTMIAVCSEYVDGLKRFAEAAIRRCREVEAKLDAVGAKQVEASSSPTTAPALDRVAATMAGVLTAAQAESDAAEAAEFRATITRLAKELDDAFLNPVTMDTPVKQDQTATIKVLGAVDRHLVSAMPLIADDAISLVAERNLALGHLPARRALYRIATGLEDVDRGVVPEIFKRQRKRAAEPSYLWDRRTDICVAVEAAHQLDRISPIEAATHIVRHHPQVQKLVGSRGGKRGRSAGPLSNEELSDIVLGWRARLNTRKRVPARAAERYREGLKVVTRLGREKSGLAWVNQYLAELLTQQVPDARPNFSE